MHLRKSRAPRRYRHPQSADDDHELDCQITEKAGSALILVGPEGQSDAKCANEYEASAAADHRGALLCAILRAFLLLALQLFECRRWLWRKSLELPFDLF